MNEEINYLEINRKSWNNRVETHLKSEFYCMEDFKKGKTSLNSIETDLLGDLEAKRFCICSAISDRIPFR
jgi:hypothetical protein